MTFSMPAAISHPDLKPVMTYVIGEPGSGKSSLVANLVGVQPTRELEKPFAHRLYACGVYELGKRRPDFPGTDALSMSVQPTVVSWLDSARPFRVIAEGDRLGNSSFFNAAEEIGYTVNVYVLWGPEAATLQRRIRGSEQDEDWVSGRRSKVRNIMESRKHVLLAAGSPLKEMAAVFHAQGDPVYLALRGGRR